MMNEPKFTDGPWHKKGKRVFWQQPDRNLPKDNLFNGLVCICATTEDNPPEVIEETNANAALIAAAPEMYDNEKSNMALLKVLREFIKSMMQEPHFIPLLDSLTTFIDKIDERMVASEQTLKKARGEE